MMAPSRRSWTVRLPGRAAPAATAAAVRADDSVLLPGEGDGSGDEPYDLVKLACLTAFSRASVLCWISLPGGGDGGGLYAGHRATRVARHVGARSIAGGGGPRNPVASPGRAVPTRFVHIAAQHIGPAR